MEMIMEIVSACGVKILAAIVLAIAGALGLKVKKMVSRHLDTEIKRTVAKIAAQFVEQVWKALHGEEKMQKALEAAAALLKKYGVTFDAEEMRMLIEAAVAEFNDVFNSATVIMDGIDAESLDDDQLRKLMVQLGFGYTENMTRQEMLDALDEVPTA